MNKQLPEPDASRRRAPGDRFTPPAPPRPDNSNDIPRRDHDRRDKPPRDSTPSPRRQPNANYAARRMLAITILITAVVAGGLSIWRLFGDDDTASPGPAASTEWNRIVLIDSRNGDQAVVLADGTLEDSESAGGAVTEVAAQGDTLALVTSRGVTMTNLKGPAVDYPIAAGADVSVLPVADQVVLAAAPAAGGNLTIMRAGATEAIDLGTLTGQPAPRFFTDSIRTDIDGKRFAVADAKNFQTVVVSDATTEPLYLAGVPLALSDKVIATSQVVGTNADITLSGNDRERLATVATDLPIGGVISNDAVLLVTQSGDVERISSGATAAERLGAVAIPADAANLSVVPAANGAVMVVLSDRFEAVISVDGSSQFSTTFTEPVTPIVPQPGWTCLPVGGFDQPHSLIDLTDGAQIADLAGTTLNAVSSDGCTVLTTTDGATELVNADGKIAIGPTKYVALAPDGRSIVRQLQDDTVEFVPINDDNTLGEAVDLTDVAPASLIATFVKT